jgi:methylmalonyl-CoA mutase cobalamin-binding domain/chain
MSSAASEGNVDDLHALGEAILNGEAEAADAITKRLLEAGVAPQAIVDGGMIPAMDEAGRRFERNEFFVPELLIAARAMKASFARLKPRLAAEGAASRGRVAIGTVRGDLHDIGKNLVAAMLEGGGFTVIDLGADVAPAAFVEAVARDGADVVALSTLLTTTMPAMKATLEALEQAGVRNRVKVMIGGAPITGQFAQQIRADGYSDNAGGAVALARRLVATRAAI